MHVDSSSRACASLRSDQAEWLLLFSIMRPYHVLSYCTIACTKFPVECDGETQHIFSAYLSSRAFEHTLSSAVRWIATTYEKPTGGILEEGGTERKQKAIQFSEEEFAHGSVAARLGLSRRL